MEFGLSVIKFPVVATIEPNEDKKNQIVMDLGGQETQFSNGKIELIFGDELIVKVSNDFYIEDNLLNSLKTSAKKLHYIYLQKFFKAKFKQVGAFNEERK